MMRPLAAAALFTLAITASAWGDGPPMGDCDRLAAHPEDPLRVHASTAIAALDGERALEACEAALTAAPETARFRYQYGRALEKVDMFQSAIRQYRIAVKEGYPAAKYAMGLIFERSKVMPFGKMKAARWYRGAADAGHPGAQFRLGLLHRTGEGVSQDEGQALTLLRHAADQGLARAQYVLGQMYDLGLGAIEDDEQAAVWYRKAASQGFVRAKLALATLTVAVQAPPGGEATAAEATAKISPAPAPLAAEALAEVEVEVVEPAAEAVAPAPKVEVAEPEPEAESEPEAEVTAEVVTPAPEAEVAEPVPEAENEPAPIAVAALPPPPPPRASAPSPDAPPVAAQLEAATATGEAPALPGVDDVAKAMGAGLSAYQAGNYETAYLSWFPLAEIGIGRAEYYIGGLLMDGHGLESDNVRAYFWLKRAATKGYDAAQPLLIELTSRMSAEEMKRAEELFASGGPKS